MRWLVLSAAVQLLCLLGIATAIPEYGNGTSKKLSGRQEALLLFKRQDTTCADGYFQCPPEFGGGCCANGRRCATLDCPAGAPGAQNTVGVASNTAPASTAESTEAPTSTAEAPTSSAPESTDEPSTTAAPTTTAEPTSAESTSAEPTSETTSAESSARTSSRASSTASQTSSVTDAADAAATTTSAPGTQYTPMGISSGAIVGIVFAGITGAVIVGLVLWRAIIGIRHPKKGKKRAGPPPNLGAGGPGAIGAAGAGSQGFFGGNRRVFGAFKNPFAKKPTGGAAEVMIPRMGDHAPMSQSAAAMGFGPQNGGGQSAPAYMQDRSSLDEHDTSYGGGNRGGLQGGDLGYRSVESFDRDDANQGLFHR